VAKRDGSKFVVNGSKAFISGGGDTDVYLVGQSGSVEAISEKVFKRGQAVALWMI
jgi:alkylation response protein AidB-like acyl-CoA dehydrogenase